MVRRWRSARPWPRSTPRAPAPQPRRHPRPPRQPADAPAAAQESKPAQAEAAADAGATAVEEQESAQAAAETEEQPTAQPEPEPEGEARAAEPEAAPAAAEAGPAEQEAAPDPTSTGGNGAARMTPAVRRLVREHDIDVAQLRAAGRAGASRATTCWPSSTRARRRLRRSGAPPQAGSSESAESPPAAQAQAQPAPEAPGQPATAVPAPSPAPISVPAPAGGDTELPLSQMRKAIARKMTQVKQTVPHAYTVIEVDMTNVVKWREANNMAFKAREGASLSYVAVVVKAVTETLRKHPNLNSQFADDKIILKQAMNIGIAVAVDNGLIVPVIANADQLSISGVNARVRDISSRAKGGKLKLDELQGGTFTVNNTGWFGSVSSMPIINAPEVAILSMEAIVKRPRVVEVAGEDVIAIRHMMNMTCSFDHRVLDGAQVGFFLADVRKALEEWDASTPLG